MNISERAAAGWPGTRPLTSSTSRVTAFHMLLTLSAECSAEFLEQCTTKKKVLKASIEDNITYFRCTFPKKKKKKKKKNVAGWD